MMAESTDHAIEAALPEQAAPALDYLQLIDRASQGDRAASDMLADDLYPKICAIAHGQCTEPSLVEDLVQEAMFTIYDRLHRYNPKFPFLPWAFKIAKARFKDILRQRLRERRVQGLSLPAENGTGRTFVSLADERAGPEEEALRNDEARRVREALASLPELHQQVIEMHFFGGVSYDAIARDFGLDRDEVYRLCYLGRQRLRPLLPQGEGPPS